MLATDFLKQQHREIEELFRQLRQDEGPDRDTPVLIRDELANQLAAHAAVEDAMFYPTVLTLLGPQCRVHEAKEEHVAADFVLARLVSVKVTDATFSARLETLFDLVMNHFEEEESELFGQYESEVERAMSEQFASNMAHAYDETIKRGHVAILSERVSLPKIGTKKAKRHVPRGMFKPLSLGSLPRVFVNLLALDGENITAFYGGLLENQEMMSWIAVLKFDLGLARDCFEIEVHARYQLAEFFTAVLALTKVSRAMFVKDFDRLLNNLGRQDFWGTEGQCDPRGDRRELGDY